MCTGGGGVEGKLGVGVRNKYLGRYETKYDICGGGGGYETINESNTMSMINKTTDFYNTIYF